MLICMSGFCPIYSFALFLPTIIKNMGYTANNAQLMSVPPYVCACFFTILASYVADRYRKRGVFLLGFQLVAILGFGMLAGSGKSHIQYTGTVFAAIGEYYLHKGYVYMLIFPSRHLPSNSSRSSMEQRQHRWQSQARNWHCDASHGRQLRWYYCFICVPQSRWAAVYKRSFHSHRFC
jgi:hypothetical protein